MRPHSLSGRTGLVLGITALITACAGPGPKPESELASAESAVEQAEASGARQYSPLMINTARNKIADARQKMAQESYQEAANLLEEAALDARLAGARAETEKSRKAVEEINTSIRNMREQLNQQPQS